MSAPVGQYVPAYSSHPDSHGQNDHQAGANMQALNLPPIRGSNGQMQVQPQLQSQPQSAANAGRPGQAAGAPPMQYYMAPGQSFPMPSGDLNQHMRYPIPPADSRMMSGGRHKKEIKRRTKTGCLTCRKRRIKCDEQHPACRNCQKSKRECLGYDPIFKAQPGPAAIQPALGTSPTSNNSGSASTYPSAYPSYPTPGVGPDGAKIEAHAYPASLDPALGSTMAQSGDNHADGQGHHVKRIKIEDLFAINGCPVPPPPPEPLPISPTVRNEIIQIYTAVFAPAIDKFLEVNWYVSRGEKHLLGNPPLCDLFMHTLQRFTIDPRDPNYPQHYATTTSLEASLIWALMSMCRAASPPAAPSSTESKQAISDANPPPDASTKAESALSGDDTKDGIQTAVKRLEIIEALLTGEYLSPDSVDDNPIPENNHSNGNDPANTSRSNGTTPFSDQLKAREVSFWSLVHAFLTLRDDEAATAKELDDAITAARSLLDSRENRDVIYSIVIARHLGNRLAESTSNKADTVKTEQQQSAQAQTQAQTQPENNDEDDVRTKLHVAKKFLEDEAGGRGTNQIVQRIGAWPPGVGRGGEAGEGSGAMR